MNVLITGVAGFLGSRLASSILDKGYRVTGLDNLSTGSLNNLEPVMDNPSFKFVKADLLDPDGWMNIFNDTDIVFHFAANPEVRHGLTAPIEHYHQNLTATINVLEASRRSDVDIVVFASSSTVYGDAEVIPTPESYPLKPISIYGATKAAAETLCETYARLYGVRCLILRYANIIGPGLTHGVIYDFIKKLESNRDSLEILGDGAQRKSYLFIDDAIDATIHLLDIFIAGNPIYDVYNIGSDDWITVREIADIIVNELDLKKVNYIYKPATQDGRGWLGDVKYMLLDITKLKNTGWCPKHGSRDAVINTVKALLNKINFK